MSRLAESLDVSLRVDTSNPAGRDFFTVRNLDGRDLVVADRSFDLVNMVDRKAGFPVTSRPVKNSVGKNGDVSKVFNQTGNATQKPGVGNREFLSFSEFLVAVRFRPESGFANLKWSEYLRHPAFPPYLGRRVYAPSTPLFLGHFESAECLFEAPIFSTDTGRTTRDVFSVGGTFTSPTWSNDGSVNVSFVNSFKDYLSWVQQHRLPR